MSEERSSLSADSPLKHPNEDELGYARFAEQLAHAVVRMAPNDGLVMSVNGSWGSGKSTVLNFMLHYLGQVEEDKRPVVVRFNPWWFSGREDLTRLLIGQICAALGEKESEFNRKLKKYLSDFTDVVSKLPSIPGVTPLSWLKTSKFFTDSLFKQPSLSELKEKIDNLLTTRSKKILVFVDDIDRLSPDEIRDLFRAIKATANFPNTIYLLAFDTQVVTKALEQGYFASGQQYLEKIIQVPFELPHPDKVALRQLLFSKLAQIITNTPEHLFDQMYWTNVYFDGIDHFINTPREIVRLINVLRATYPAVQGEVNPVDFIAIEAFRVFRPEMYDIIRKNENFLVGASDSSERNGQEKYSEIYKSWINQVPERDQKAVERILVRLFPRFERLFSNIIYSSDFSSTWRKNLRICSPEIFPVYFRFNVSEDSITASEMQMLLNASQDSMAFEKELINYSSQTRRDGTTRLRAILERFEDYTKEDIPTQNIEPIIFALFKVGDELLKKEDDHRGMFDFGNDMRIGRIVYQLLSRLEEEQRFQILYKAIEEGAALSISEREVSVLGQQHGKFTNSEPQPESERFINAEHLSSLEQLVLGKIREAAKLGILLTTPKLTSILWRWKAWSESDDEVKQWVADITKDDKNLAIFIEHFGNIHHVHSQGNLSSKAELRLEPKRLEPFIDPDDIVYRVRRLINRNDLPEEQIEAAKQFVKEYDLLSQGKDPDDQW
jgi:predicted KAP-like P-loop ATPase